MYGYNMFSRGLSLIKILNGLSKGLNIANQVIPIYNKAKPMVNNTKSLLTVLKSININDKPSTKKNIETKKESLTDSSNYNNPQFFI